VSDVAVSSCNTANLSLQQ